jgi:hypothetical protein
MTISFHLHNEIPRSVIEDLRKHDLCFNNFNGEVDVFVVDTFRDAFDAYMTNPLSKIYYLAERETLFNVPKYVIVVRSWTELLNKLNILRLA